MQGLMEKMSRHAVGPRPGFGASQAGGVLKSLLESPVKLLPMAHEGFAKDQEKEKALDEERSAPQSAFLGPTLWDKTLPYDGDCFQLEYMDLEEFLSENGIPSSPAQLQNLHQSHAAVTAHTSHVQIQPHTHNSAHNLQHNLQHNHHGNSHTHAHTHTHTHSQSQSHAAHTSRHHVTIISQAPSPATVATTTAAAATTTTTTPLPPAMESQQASTSLLSSNHIASVVDCLNRAGLHTSRDSPSPIDPDSISVCVGYEPDPTDLALSSIPGQATFDPRNRRFTLEELKPQPMIKKARKIYIPEDMKDERYWARRRKNNVAAKRSRDARRLKENQIAIRAAFLERENCALRGEVAGLRMELHRAQGNISKYHASHGPL